MKRTPWLVVGAVSGAFLGFLTAPPVAGSSWMHERGTWLYVVWIISGAMLGVVVGFLIGVADRR